MLKPIRKTLTGQVEYWDTEKQLVMVVADKEDMVVTADKQTFHESEIINFSNMTVKELKQFAADHDIDIPSDITKKDDIIQYLTDDSK